MNDLTDLFLQERKTVKEVEEQDPRLVQIHNEMTAEEELRFIGINFDKGFLPQGYSNFYPQDFIVEEIDQDGRVRTIQPENFEMPPKKPGEKTIFADMVKVGLSTLEARQMLASKLHVKDDFIRFAGIKDKVAITSQRISIRSSKPEDVNALDINGIFLKNFSWGKGTVKKGDNVGNRFSIVIRTPSTMGSGWLEKQIEGLQKEFYNFYYLQRFGTPRLLSAKLGRLILQKNFQGAVRTFMCDDGASWSVLLKNIRRNAARHFGEWKEMKEIFSVLPYTFRLEIELCDALAEKPKDFASALRVIKDQSFLWVQAYGSYMFNIHISNLIKSEEEMPESLPLLLHPEYKNVSTYMRMLAKDRIKEFDAPLRAVLGTVPRSEAYTAKTIQPVKNLNAKVVENAVVLGFDLPTGSYATTFLSHMFVLNRGLPVPEWVCDNTVDSQKVLGKGSLENIDKKFGQFMVSRDETF